MLYFIYKLAQAKDELPEVLDVEDAVQTGQLLAEAVQSGNWTVAAAMALTLTVFVVRRFLWKEIPKKWIPYSSLGLAVAAEVAVALYAGADPLAAVLSGLVLGLAAVGGWEFIKGIFKKKTEAAGWPEGEKESEDPPTQP
tara:strand:+ start:1097 stop:1516 length:420 start_codon:yes stop_codon:yes gene_type:complete